MPVRPVFTGPNRAGVRSQQEDCRLARLPQRLVLKICRIFFEGFWGSYCRCQCAPSLLVQTVPESVVSRKTAASLAFPKDSFLRSAEYFLKVFGEVTADASAPRLYWSKPCRSP